MRTVIDLKPAIAIVETERNGSSSTKLTLMVPGDAEVAPESVFLTLSSEQVSSLVDALQLSRGLRVAT